MPTLTQDSKQADYSQKAAGVVYFIAMAVLAILLALAFITWRTPGQIYQSLYTNQGKCLHGTPYDPDKGAQVVVLQQEGSSYPLLTVIPRDANFEKPSVLFFSVVTKTGDSSQSLLGADDVVTSFMYEKCRVDLR